LTHFSLRVLFTVSNFAGHLGSAKTAFFPCYRPRKKEKRKGKGEKEKEKRREKKREEKEKTLFQVIVNS
jgi:hypothetical protein